MSPKPLPESQPPEKTQKDPLLDVFKGPLLKLVQDDVRGAVDPEKIYQYAQLRKNELYWRGQQYLDEVWSTDGNLVDYRPINGQWHQEHPEVDSSAMYDTVINDMRGYGRKFVAVLAQQPPNVKAEPNDNTNQVHINRAKTAQRLADKLYGIWNVKAQNRQVYLVYYKDGTAFGFTDFVADEEKFGFREEPVMTPQPTPVGPPMMNCIRCGQQTPVEGAPPTQCPDCGYPFGPEDQREPEMAMLPQQTGTTRYANGCVEHHVESGMRVTTPFDIQTLADAPWLLYEYEEHKGRLFALFPELREKLGNTDSGEGDGGSAGVVGRTTRDIASSPAAGTTAPRHNRLLYTQIWLRPAMYELAKGEVELPGKEGGPPVPSEFRKALKKHYPSGVRITIVNGDTLVKLQESRMDAHWTLSPPEPAENAYPDPLCTDYMDTQDQTNDFANIERQTWERAIPQVFIDTQRIDTTYQTKYRQLPGSFIPIRGTVGGNINDAIGHVPVAVPEPKMSEYGEKQRLHGAEIIGITPQVYGGGAAEQTAYATNLKRNQAMLQLSTSADAGRAYWAKVTYNAVMLMAKHSNGQIPSPYAPDTESEQIEGLDELLQGGWHFESADSMPMSWSERREQLNENLKNAAGNPELLGMLGFMLPANIPQLQDELLGMPDWQVPNQDALAKVHACIRELLEGKPTEQPSQDGMGVIQIPSVPVDEWDNHGFFAQALADWLCTEQALDIRGTNPEGFMNVVAFWKAHAGLALPPPMAEGEVGPDGEPTSPDGPPGTAAVGPPAGGSKPPSAPPPKAGGLQPPPQPKG